MTFLLFSPIVLQGIFMFFDEFYFHHQRGLGRWERWGHPLDTISLLVPFGIAAFLPYTGDLLWWFVGLALFSCLFVTKDEFVHAEICRPMEHWLHAVLFILHPLSFLAAGFLWAGGEQSLLRLQFFLVLAFLIYQISYWGFYVRSHGQTSAGQ